MQSAEQTVDGEASSCTFVLPYIYKQLHAAVFLKFLATVCMHLFGCSSESACLSFFRKFCLSNLISFTMSFRLIFRSKSVTIVLHKLLSKYELLLK